MAITHWIDRDAALASLNRPDPLQRLQLLIPWEDFRPILEAHLYPPRATTAGASHERDEQAFIIARMTVHHHQNPH